MVEGTGLICYSWVTVVVFATLSVRADGCPTTGENCSIPCPQYCQEGLCNITDGTCKGCVLGYYGENCSESCPQNCQEGLCHVTDGTCLGCLAGYKGPFCSKECDGNTYGPECNISCGNCFNGEQCDHVTGVCAHGCDAGVYGYNCDKVCDDGMYGVNCSKYCGACINNESCHHINGSCLTGCNKGYHGQECDKACSDGYYGYNCEETCSLTCGVPGGCDRVTGSCNGSCLSGWKGIMCEHACDDGMYGVNCSQKCGGCINNEACHHINGSCLTGCEKGYHGQKCDNACSDGYYGYNCEKTCSLTCAVPGECNRITGSCNGSCLTGWKGSNCEHVCDDGMYGVNCSQKCGACEDDEACHHINGSCLTGCERGYYGQKCEKECDSNTFGQDCVEECGNCVNDEQCHHINGTCLHGCKRGFQGIECNQDAFSGYTTRFLGYSVYISNTTNKEDGVLCFRDTNYTRATIPNPVNITCPYHGRYVIYYNNRTHPPYPEGYSHYAFNELCELEVHGCPTSGFYGENCSSPCPKNCQERHCHITEGTCLGCLPGYRSLKCDTSCPRGLFGDGCLYNCSLHCNVPMECDRVTGRCFDGCQSGWGDPTCRTKVEILYIKDGEDSVCTAFYGALAPLILSVIFNVLCAIRLIGKTAACRHREASKQNEASFPKTDHAHGEIYDHVGNNSAYQELGELSKPTVYETLS
ncbi:uncharacterized protein LOC111113178 isoform X2 [Crassostrea virginica]